MSDSATIILTGRLGKDPVGRETKNGKLMVTFSIASGRWNASTKEEDTSWYEILCFNKTADLAIEFCKKGDRVLVIGIPKIEKREYEGKTYTDVRVLATTIDRMGFLRDPERKAAAPAPGVTGSGQGVPGAPAPAADFDDNIPF